MGEIIPHGIYMGFSTNLYLSILLHYVTHNILSLFRLGETIYTILSFRSFTTCFGPTWPSSGEVYFARLSHCHTLCLYKSFLEVF
jgi:hypothetical protein